MTKYFFDYSMIYRLFSVKQCVSMDYDDNIFIVV